MDEQLSITEIRLIRSMLAKKTNDQLADLTGKPVELIQKAIEEMTGVIKRPKKKKKTAASKKGRPAGSTAEKAKLKKKLAEQRKQAELRRRIKMEHERRERLKRRMEAQRIPDRKIDLTGKVAVKLNHKTFVYVKPGTDIEALKIKLKIK